MQRVCVCVCITRFALSETLIKRILKIIPFGCKLSCRCARRDTHYFSSTLINDAISLHCITQHFIAPDTGITNHHRWIRSIRDIHIFHISIIAREPVLISPAGGRLRFSADSTFLQQIIVDSTRNVTRNNEQRIRSGAAARGGKLGFGAPVDAPIWRLERVATRTFVRSSSNGRQGARPAQGRLIPGPYHSRSER